MQKIEHEKKTFIGNLDWRYAVKSFDKDKKVNNDDIDKIKHAMRYAPSSFGLQPYRIIVVEDQDMKNKLKEASFNQSQVFDCSHFFVFVSDADMHRRISEFCDLAEHKSKGLFDKMKAEATMRGFAVMLNEHGKRRWASEQAYVSLGFGLAACAELGIDSCPMGGFSADKYKNILGLADHEEACVVLAVGYRAEEPSFEKTRFEDSVIFKTI